MKLTKLSTTGTFPKRTLHSSCFVENKNEIFIFGGYDDSNHENVDNFVLSDVTSFNLNSNKFMKMSNMLPGRYGHTSNYIESFDTIITIAGINNVFLYTPSVEAYDVSSNSFRSVNTSGNFIPRNQHTATVVNGFEKPTIVVIGGASDSATDVVVVFTLTSLITGGSWSRVTFTENMFQGSYHTSQFYASSIYIFYGRNGGVRLSDIWNYNPIENTYAKFHLENGFIPRDGLTSNLISGDVYLIGGVNASTYFSDVWVFAFTSKEPTTAPTLVPSNSPTLTPTISTAVPTFSPTAVPTFSPTISHSPTTVPTVVPTISLFPTQSPTQSPTQVPVSNSSNSLSMEAAIAIIVCSIFGFILCICAVGFWCGRRTKPLLSQSLFLDVFSSGNSKGDIEMSEASRIDLESSIVPSFSFSSVKNNDKIDWSEIKVFGKDISSVFIGRGSFGSVVRANWEPKNLGRREVAIKILERRMTDTNEQYLAAVGRAREELSILKYAESQIGSDNIVKAYGLAEGPLSKQFQDMFHTTMDTVGIVMRYEAGGNLSDYLHGRNGGMAAKLSIVEKVSLLVGIAQGLSELHSVGIIHGDIKPENILLDRIPNPKVRLADFGLSKIMEKFVGSNDLSTLRETKHVKGTLTYCAPEMLHDPRNPKKKEVASASRKTDIFAFAILAWEVLAQTRPFRDMTTEGELSVFLHDSGRPSLEELSSDAPPVMSDLLQRTWSQERSKRISAVEAFSICQFARQTLSQQSFDIFFSHAWASKPFLSHVYRELTKAGYRVWYDQNDMGYDITKSMRDGIMNSKVVLACVNPLYQSRENCMFELREARKMNKNIISLVIEGNPFEWANDEMKEICDFKTKMFVNISSVASLPWENESGGTKELISKLKVNLQSLLVLLKEIKCNPSMIVDASNENELML